MSAKPIQGQDWFSRMFAVMLICQQVNFANMYYCGECQQWVAMGRHSQEKCYAEEETDENLSGAEELVGKSERKKGQISVKW